MGLRTLDPMMVDRVDRVDRIDRIDRVDRVERVERVESGSGNFLENCFDRFVRDNPKQLARRAPGLTSDLRPLTLARGASPLRRGMRSHAA